MNEAGSHTGSNEKPSVSYIHDMEGGKKDEGPEFLHTIVDRYARVDPTAYLRRSDEGAFHYWGRRLGAIKPVELLLGEAKYSDLRKVLRAWQLIFVGIGAIIGTGIFVLSGQAAAEHAGPAVTISFIVAGVAAGILIRILCAQP